jgi:C-terminal processing protease CtpA/Prc
MNCFVGVLEALDDVHSHIMLNQNYYGYYHPVDDTTYLRLKPILDKASSVTGAFYSTILADHFAYIRVPSINAYIPDQINAYGQTLRDTVCTFQGKNIKGFIIDLRLNTGGNMYPMLGGLSDLLGNTIIGYETEMDGSVVRTWKIENGNLILEGYQATQLENKCHPDFSETPVVVLVGPVTSSSGTMTAIAFKNRPKTTFIGEPTASGYTTSNGYFQFAPNLTMNFATQFVADRNKKIYKLNLTPDKFISGGDRFDDLMIDEKIKAALEYLTAQ